MATRLTSDEKKAFAEHVMQWGNGVFFGLVIAQAIAEKPFDYFIAGVGFVMLAAAYWVAYILMKEGR